MATLNEKKYITLAQATKCKKRVSGITHNFYRYPARFSPEFASTAINQFSKPGDLIFDPYMGGGTTLVEAMTSGRKAIGSDLNSLAVFVAKVKTTPLKPGEIKNIREWADTIIPSFSYHHPLQDIEPYIDDAKTSNMNLPCGRFLKKLLAVALKSVDDFQSVKIANFAKCAILKTGQWALDGKKTHTSLEEFRKKLANTTHEMLDAIIDFKKEIKSDYRKIYESDAAEVNLLPCFSRNQQQVDLVVTSPPYPGVHMLYHRWQVDGRKETPAPYWIADCLDGHGSTYYNFGSRHEENLNTYFDASLNTLQSIREVMKNGSLMIQLIAFNNSKSQLPRYLTNMELAGFKELYPNSVSNRKRRIWRSVPNRKWHAALKGTTSGSNEVVLIHRAI